MRKTFKLTHPKIKVPRLVDAIKHEIKKYVTRERKRALPKGFDYWDFDCKYGATAEQARKIHLAEIGKHIDQAHEQNLETFYLEVITKPARRKKPNVG